MPHPRPTGSPDALSIMLRSATAPVHAEAERQPFMQAFFAASLPRDAYVAWLARQWHIYWALESGLEALPAGSAESGLVATELYRSSRIEVDLDHLTDATWRNINHLSPATRAYVERIESTSSFAAGLIVHAWLRYMGNVGGRDVLRRLAAASIGADESDDRGLSFTDFSAVGDIRPFFASFHAKLDTLPLSADDKARSVAEADAGFRHNIALTEELARDYGI